MPVVVAAGTTRPIDLIGDPDTGLKTKYVYPEIRATVTNLTLLPDGLFDQMRDFINLWQHTSDDAPTWISCPDAPMLESALRDHYKVGEMAEDWEFDIGSSERVLVEENLDVNPDPGGDAIAVEEE